MQNTIPFAWNNSFWPTTPNFLNNFAGQTGNCFGGCGYPASTFTPGTNSFGGFPIAQTPWNFLQNSTTPWNFQFPFSNTFAPTTPWNRSFPVGNTTPNWNTFNPMNAFPFFGGAENFSATQPWNTFSPMTNGQFSWNFPFSSTMPTWSNPQSFFPGFQNQNTWNTPFNAWGFNPSQFQNNWNVPTSYNPSTIPFNGYQGSTCNTNSFAPSFPFAGYPFSPFYGQSPIGQPGMIPSPINGYNTNSIPFNPNMPVGGQVYPTGQLCRDAA